MSVRPLLTVVIPTYGREQVLINTLTVLDRQFSAEHELLVVDQTSTHEPGTERSLASMMQRPGRRLIRLAVPSVTAAMNRGLIESRGELVLFLDDDIVPGDGLFNAHIMAHGNSDPQTVLIAGRVVQPWHRNIRPGQESPFLWSDSRSVTGFMGGNFSVKRNVAIGIGGFDQNFRYAAYRYENDFADRIHAAGFQIRYEPGATIDHLKAADGGVRAFGNHLTTLKPGHALGAYYYLLKSGQRVAPGIARRMWGSFSTRFHLTHPWYVPVTIVAELRGLLQAIRLWRAGPAQLDPEAG